jgi:hypothetical protein
LAFILDNLGRLRALDFGAATLEHVQTVYEQIKDTNDSIDMEWRDNLLHIVPLYIGEGIIHHTDGRWTAETRKSFLHQGPYRVTGFGDMEWETYYPAQVKQFIAADPRKITTSYTDALNVWNVRCQIVSGATDYFRNNPGRHTIPDIMYYLEVSGVAPQSRFGEARFRQFQKRVTHVLKNAPEFTRIAGSKDAIELKA